MNKLILSLYLNPAKTYLRVNDYLSQSYESFSLLLVGFNILGKVLAFKHAKRLKFTGSNNMHIVLEEMYASDADVETNAHQNVCNFMQISIYKSYIIVMSNI